VGKTDRRRGAGYFLHGDDVREIAHRRAAVGFLDGDAEQSQVAHLAPQVGGKLVGGIDLRRAWRDFLQGEIAHGIAQHGDALAVVEVEIAHSANLFRVVRGVGQHHQGLLHRRDVRAVLSVHLGARHGKRPARLDHLAARDQRAARRREDVHLVFDGHERCALRHQAVGGVARRRVGDHADDAAVHEALLLGEVGAVGQADFARARLDRGERRADQGHRFLAGEAVPDVLHKVCEYSQALRLRKRQPGLYSPSDAARGKGAQRVLDQRAVARVRDHAARHPLLRGPGPDLAAPRRPAAGVHGSRPHAPQADPARQAPRTFPVRDPRADRHVRARPRRAAAARALPRRARVAPGKPVAAAHRHRGATFRDPDVRKTGAQAAQALMPSLDYPYPETPAPGETIEVAPGVRWLSMPLPFALDHINLWLVGDTIVDTGIGDATTRGLWERILAGKEIRRIVLTHYHPDHAGNAAWLVQKFGAEFWTTQGEYLTAHAVRASSAGYTTEAVLEVFRKNGLAAERAATMGGRGNRYAALVPEFPLSYRRIIDGDRVKMGGHEWRAFIGHGH